MQKLSLFLMMLLMASGSIWGKRTEVYFENTEGWDKVCIFSWGDAGTMFGEWPGTELTETKVVDGYTVYVAEVDTGNQIIFNNDNGVQTEDLNVVPGNIYRYNSTNSDPTGLGQGNDPVNPDEYPELYLRGTVGGSSWNVEDRFKFSVDDSGVYSLKVDNLEGEFKIASSDWSVDYGSIYGPNGTEEIGANSITEMKFKTKGDKGYNWKGTGVKNAELKFKYVPGQNLTLTVTGEGQPVVIQGLSGTLPVLYINVYTDETMSVFNNEIIDINLDHKNYFSFANYWLDMNGCEWLEAEGGKSVGSAGEPLPLEIKARGNWTRKGFAKKPFKLKLGKKQSLLGMTKSKHYAILAHADDSWGYLRNFTGFNMGKRIGLPWTPAQQPIEVVINGNYRGLYFLTESIRIGDDRVMIEELKDNETDPGLVSGGYLVELDNYEEENQIRMPEKTCGYTPYVDELRITWDTPEEYSDIQKQFVTDQFTAMNDNIGSGSNATWKYLDLDDAARYYLVEEILSHTESYHGSTYLFRDRGEGKKWHFSPLWDFGNAFSGPTDDFFYHHGPFGNTWVASMRENDMFNDKVTDTWVWFMQNCFDGLYEDMKVYADHLKAAAEADYKRWNGQPTPWNGVGVTDNRDMDSRLSEAKKKIADKIAWLKGEFGNYSELPHVDEPARDTTPAAPLPEYISSVRYELAGEPSDNCEYFDLTGMRITKPVAGTILIERKAGNVRKVIIR